MGRLCPSWVFDLSGYYQVLDIKTDLEHEIKSVCNVFLVWSEEIKFKQSVIEC